MNTDIWDRCSEVLSREYSEQEYNTWIRPLQSEVSPDVLILLAPNRFVIDWIKQHYYERIVNIVKELSLNSVSKVIFKIGSVRKEEEESHTHISSTFSASQPVDNFVDNQNLHKFGSYLNRDFTFNQFVKGKSNEFAFAAASQVASRPGDAYNPLLIYGGVGLGKTHLMTAVGNEVLSNRHSARVLFLHSERFVANMIFALQNNTIDEFKRFYRSVDVLLIDDIQFFAGKDRSQEEFFHLFNSLLEEHKQIVLTCDRYPKEINGLKERLKSRFGWGLTVAIEPPELETRVAILMNKAEQTGVKLSSDVAFFVAKHIRSNVRELEGALKRIVANAEFTGRPITVDFVKDALKDLLTLQDKLVTVENIQRTVAEYYKIKLNDLLSKRRSRSVARPRQVAMALSKELTNHSLPEIGNSFGGRDHTTVLHACRQVKNLVDSSNDIHEDYSNLLRILTG